MKRLGHLTQPLLTNNIGEKMNILEKSNQEYYSGKRPSLTDDEYDILKEALPQADDKIGYINKSEKNKVSRNIPMLSLKKVVRPDDLKMFFFLKDLVDNEFIVEPKIDGLAISVKYKNG